MSKQSNIRFNWHPDFKIESTLPDTRMIRTHFMAKIAVYTAILIVLVFVLRQEYQVYTLRQEISGLEQQIQNASSADLARLKKSEQFRELALNVKELQRFFRVPLMAHDSIVELALTKPEGLAFTRLALSERVVQIKVGRSSKSQVAYQLNISGNVDDLPVLTQFKRSLEESRILNPFGYTVNISEDIEQRDVNTGIVSFQLSILLEPAKNNPAIK